MRGEACASGESKGECVDIKMDPGYKCVPHDSASS